jgi:hypothetical protein
MYFVGKPVTTYQFHISAGPDSCYLYSESHTFVYGVTTHRLSIPIYLCQSCTVQKVMLLFTRSPLTSHKPILKAVKATWQPGKSTISLRYGASIIFLSGAFTIVTNILCATYS